MSAPDESEIRVFRFRTRRDGRDRTAGVLAELPAAESIASFGDARAKLMAERFPVVGELAAVAQGKVAILKRATADQISSGVVFQSAQGRCRRADCGNAAAAIAMANGRNAPSTAFDLRGSDSKTTHVVATVVDGLVRQSWTVSTTPRISTLVFDGRQAIEIAGFFNNYIVVNARPEDAGISTLLRNDPLCRVATVDLRRGHLATAAFYTSGKRHPSAPLTGLAVLAFAATRVDWLEPLCQMRSVRVNGLREPLPAISVRPDSIELDLPETSVTLEFVGSGMPGQERAA